MFLVLEAVIDVPIFVLLLQPSGLFGFTALEGGLLVAPIFLYLVFIVYRTSFNPKAKVLHWGLFILAVGFCILTAFVEWKYFEQSLEGEHLLCK